MSTSFRYLGSTFVIFLVAEVASINAESQGFVEGHLKILSARGVDLGDENAAIAATENYADYPLLILRRDKQKEIARITADTNGNYRAVLPPGDYVLDVQGRTQGRTRGYVRAKPQPFTVASNQTVRVDMVIYPEHWRVGSPQSFRPD
jgi:hypothetical protein